MEIYKLASTLSDFANGSYIYPISKWNNIRTIALTDFDYNYNPDARTDIYYGDLPSNFAKSRYSILISDTFDPNYDINLFIPKPSYLEVDALAFADDMRVKVFSNAKNSILMDMLVNTLAETNLIPINMAEMSNWNNRADEFIQNIELDDQIIPVKDYQEVEQIMTYRDMIVKK